MGGEGGEDFGLSAMGGEEAELPGSLLVGHYLEDWTEAVFQGVVGRMVRVSVRGLLPGF